MYQCDELCRKYVKRSMKVSNLFPLPPPYHLISHFFSQEKIYKGLETKAKLFFLFVLTHSEGFLPSFNFFLSLSISHFFLSDVEDQLLCVNEFKKLQQVFSPSPFFFLSSKSLLFLFLNFQKELEVDDPLHIFETIFGRHLTTIQRFGRFPHRNGILKRTTTEEEEV